MIMVMVLSLKLTASSAPADRTARPAQNAGRANRRRSTALVIVGLPGTRSAAIPVKLGDETRIVDAAEMVDVPQLHRIDLQRILVLADALLIDVGDRPHRGEQLRLEHGRDAVIGDGRHGAIHLAFLEIALLDDVDRLLRPRLEEMHALHDALEEALDDVGMLLDEVQARGDGGEPDHRHGLDVDDAQSGRFGEERSRRVEQRRVDIALFDQLPQRRQAQAFRIRLVARIHVVFLVVDLVDDLDLVAIHIEAALLEIEPVVQARMRAARADLLAAQIADTVDAGIGPHYQLVVHLIDGLAEIDPAVAAGAVGVGRDMVAADELDIAGGNRAMRLGGGDIAIVVDLEPVPLPGAGFGDDMQQDEMRARAIGKGDTVQFVPPGRVRYPDSRTPTFANRAAAVKYFKRFFRFSKNAPALDVGGTDIRVFEKETPTRP